MYMLSDSVEEERGFFYLFRERRFMMVSILENLFTLFL